MSSPVETNPRAIHQVLSEILDEAEQAEVESERREALARLDMYWVSRKFDKATKSVLIVL